MKVNQSLSRSAMFQVIRSGRGKVVTHNDTAYLTTTLECYLTPIRIADADVSDRDGRLSE
jgi:hypothetical protein